MERKKGAGWRVAVELGAALRQLRSLRGTMKRFLESLGGRFSGASRPAAGIYHYRRELADRLLRLHLRIEVDGSGLLVINASGVLHLNPTAAFLVKLILEGSTRAQAVALMRKVYRAEATAVSADYDRILSIVTELESSEDACPVWRLAVPDAAPFEKDVSAPYRVDLALNYECNNSCIHCYVSRRPGEKEPLSVEQWKHVLQRLWDVGVPHVCFTGGEATLSPQLAELIERAEDIGLVTGLLTNGRRLADRAFVGSLCAAGLDHVQITLESSDEAVHDEMVGCAGAFKETVQGIRNAIDDDVYVVTNTTLCGLNTARIEETISFLAEIGVRQFAMNSFIQTGAAPASGEGLPEADLADVVDRVVHCAEEVGLRFIWYTPTHYCQFNPAEHGVGLKRCTAAEYSLCVEPDGGVIPCQSYYEPVGNILRDSWDSIWNCDLFKRIRSRVDVSEACRGCPDFSVCGSGCPLSGGDRFLCTDSVSGS